MIPEAPVEAPAVSALTVALLGAAFSSGEVDAFAPVSDATADAPTVPGEDVSATEVGGSDQGNSEQQ